MRRSIRILAFVALGLIMSGCTVQQLLFINNETDGHVTLIVTCGSESFEMYADPGKWTESGEIMACRLSDDIEVAIRGESDRAKMVMVNFKDYNTIEATAFVRLDSSGLHKTDVPLWYHIREKGPISLILLFLIAVIVTPVFFIGRAIWRQNSARSEKKKALAG